MIEDERLDSTGILEPAGRSLVMTGQPVERGWVATCSRNHEPDDRDAANCNDGNEGENPRSLRAPRYVHPPRC